MTSIWVRAMNAWNCLILAAIITPKAVNVKANNSSSPMSVRNSTALYGTCANPARAKKTRP